MAWNTQAEALAPKAIGIRAQTAVISVRTRLALAGTRAEAFAIESRATVLALEQALQQRQGASARLLPGMALVLPPRLLDGGEHRGLHECGDRDRDPVLRGDITERLSGNQLFIREDLMSDPRPGSKQTYWPIDLLPCF